MTANQFKKKLNETDGIISHEIFTDIIWNLIDISREDFLGHSIEFKNCTFNGMIVLQNLNLDNCSIKFENCEFLNQNVSPKSRFPIPRFYITNFNLESINFINSTINKIDIEQCKLNLVDFSNSEVITKINIQNSEIELCLLSINNSKTIEDINIDSPKLKELYLNTSTPVKKLNIISIESLFVESDVNEVEIFATDFKTIEFCPKHPATKLNIRKFDFSESNFSGMMTLEDLEVDKLILNNCNSSNGTLRLNEVHIKSAEITDVSINKFYLNQVHFIEELDLQRCDLSGLRISYVKWLKDHKISDSFIDDKVPWFYQLRKKTHRYDSEDISQMQYERDTYRQLKAASFANQNNIEALTFYRNEMRLYWKEIRIQGGVSPQDRFLVFLNRIISDFGQSWGLPLVWLFGVHFILFMSIFEWHFSFEMADFKRGLGEYFQLLNPVHKTPEYINSGMGLFTEFWMRVLGGFFIYHFIRATRKFAKI